MRPIFLFLLIFCFNSPMFGQNLENSPIKENPLAKFKLKCVGGSKVKGEIDRWSLLSKCPAGYTVTGLQRIDLTGDHNNPIVHVNDFTCDDAGCKAWCIGSPCTVEARCCIVSD